MNSPPKQPASPVMTDHQIIFLKLWVNKLAVICGKVSREMASTIPTMRRHDTMVSAMNIIRIYSNKATGIHRWNLVRKRSDSRMDYILC